MLRTITIGTCVSIQGVFERQAANGNIVVRVGARSYEGRAVESDKAAPATQAA